MAERQTSSKSGIPSAGRGMKTEKEEEVKLAPEQELVFLQETLRRYQQAGGKVLVIPEFYDAGQRMVAILLPGVAYEAGDLQTIVAETK